MMVQTRELSEAYDWLNAFRASRKEPDLHQAWDLYYHVFKRINKSLASLTQLELQYVAPALVRAQGMELAVPGELTGGGGKEGRMSCPLPAALCQQRKNGLHTIGRALLIYLSFAALGDCLRRQLPAL
jgi:hypothetical protein